MGAQPERALYQRFPMLGRERAQIWSCSPAYRRPRHFHAEPELNLVVAGSAIFGVGRSVLAVRAGEVLAFPPGQDHVLLHGTEDLVLFVVGMTPSFSSDVLRSGYYCVNVPLLVRPAADEFRTLVASASAVVGQDRAEQNIAELWERVHHSSSLGLYPRGQGIHVLTRLTLQAVSDEPDLGREDLARRARANPSEISRHFHRDIGMTLVQFKTRLRLLRFIQQVDKRVGDLLAAAIEAGFGSYSQCHRSFQAEFGCAPRQFFCSGLRERMEQVFEPYGTLEYEDKPRLLI